MKINDRLLRLGYNDKLQDYLTVYNSKNNSDYLAGRVAVVNRGLYKVFTAEGEVLAAISGKMQHRTDSLDQYPVVGDWVIVNAADSALGHSVINEIFPRKSRFSRKVAGRKTSEQILAANIDYLFICISLNQDFNIRRLERYLIMAWEGGACPVIALTKADLCADIPQKLSQVQTAALGVNTHVVSVVSQKGLAILKEYLKTGQTVALIGSSGVGKSTLINYLAGSEILSTSPVRSSDGKGRHTTTHRELVILKDGGIVIDTPGMRELHIMDVDQGINSTFKDIEELARSCRFRDCRHQTEPHCAEKQAVESGELSAKRLSNYFKLQKEAAYMERKNRIKQIKNKSS